MRGYQRPANQAGRLKRWIFRENYRDPEEGGQDRARELHGELLAPFAHRAVGRSLNFSFGPATPEEVRAGFDPGDYDRLRALKSRVDPGGLIRAGHPIPPAPQG